MGAKKTEITDQELIEMIHRGAGIRTYDPQGSRVQWYYLMNHRTTAGGTE